MSRDVRSAPFRIISGMAKNRPALAPFIAALSKARRLIRGGGVTYDGAEQVFLALTREAGLSPERSLADYVAELRSNEMLRRHFETVAHEKQHNLAKFSDWNRLIDTHTAQIALFYATLRVLKPRMVIETGTATGSMTAIELSALERNGGEGRLVSIDLPPVQGKLTMDVTVTAEDVGFFIPPELRHRWEYRLGDAKLLVPPALAELDPDVFIHDSLHTRSHMVFEYATARALMRPGTLILSDDISWNNGFDDFLALNRLTGHSPLDNPNIGGFVNRFDPFETSIGTAIIR